MDEPQAAVFDELEREWVRRALWRYMAEHGIGIPKLQYLIIKADKPRHRVIPLATLTRFLKNRHRTKDEHVAPCHAFAKHLPYYGQDADIARLGQALSECLRGRSRELDAADIARLGEALSGSRREQKDDERRDALTVTLQRISDRFFKAGFEKGSAPAVPPEAIISYLILELALGRSWQVAREFEPVSYDDEGKLESRRAFDGVAIFAAPLIYILLRDSLFRRLKYYLLAEAASPAQQKLTTLGGHVLDAYRDGGPRESQSVRFIPGLRETAS